MRANEYVRDVLNFGRVSSASIDRYHDLAGNRNLVSSVNISTWTGKASSECFWGEEVEDCVDSHRRACIRRGKVRMY